MPRGPQQPRFCAICNQSCGKRSDKVYAHAREVHGGSALTKSKAVEQFPDAKQSAHMSELAPEETCWVVRIDSVPVLFAEADLFKVGPWFPHAVAAVADPPKARKSGLIALHDKLVELQGLVRKAEEVLDEVLGGEAP